MKNKIQFLLTANLFFCLLFVLTDCSWAVQCRKCKREIGLTIECPYCQKGSEDFNDYGVKDAYEEAMKPDELEKESFDSERKEMRKSVSENTIQVETKLQSENSKVKFEPRAEIPHGVNSVANVAKVTGFARFSNIEKYIKVNNKKTFLGAYIIVAGIIIFWDYPTIGFIIIGLGLFLIISAYFAQKKTKRIRS